MDDGGDGLWTGSFGGKETLDKRRGVVLEKWSRQNGNTITDELEAKI